MRKTDQARASRGCRTSPAPAARGPRSSPRWCRCGWWSGTAATPTPAPSAAPHNGDTRRRSRRPCRLRWPGRPLRPRIKLPRGTVSFWRVLFSLSPVSLPACLPAAWSQALSQCCSLALGYKYLSSLCSSLSLSFCLSVMRGRTWAQTPSL